MEHNFERSKVPILPPSRATSFELARQDWERVAVAISEELDNCPCASVISGRFH
jgi:hypothetical protein